MVIELRQASITVEAFPISSGMVSDLTGPTGLGDLLDPSTDGYKNFEAELCSDLGIKAAG